MKPTHITEKSDHIVVHAGSTCAFIEGPSIAVCRTRLLNYANVRKVFIVQKGCVLDYMTPAAWAPLLRDLMVHRD